MKSIFLLLITIIGIIGCQSTETKQEQEEVTLQKNVVIKSDTLTPNTLGLSPNPPAPAEYIEWNNIKINNALPLSANVRQVNALFGKADSTFTPDYENLCNNCHFCYEEIPPFKNAYFKGVEFEQLNDSVEFWSADFTLNKSLFLQNGNMRFDYKTTLEEVSKVFPMAVREKQIKGLFTLVRISPSKQLVDGVFILEFNKEGYLITFDYWFPC